MWAGPGMPGCGNEPKPLTHLTMFDRFDLGMAIVFAMAVKQENDKLRLALKRVQNIAKDVDASNKYKVGAIKSELADLKLIHKIKVTQ